MNLRSIKNVVTSKAGRQLLKFQKNSPAILFATGVVGMVGTVVLASRATLKLDEVLDETEKLKAQAHETLEMGLAKYSEQDFKRDMIILYTKQSLAVGKLYAPAFLCGVVSIAALTGSHFILNSRNVALTAAYAAIEKGYNQYRERVRQELGEEKDRQFQHGAESFEVIEQMADGKVAKQQITAVTNRDGLSPYAVIFDESNKNWNREGQHNQFFIQCQQNFAQDLFRARGHLFLNEVYDMLGMPRTSAGQIVGWVSGHGDDFVDFGVFRNDTFMGQQFANGNERSIILDFNVAGPVYDKI